ncbi:acyl-CoA thioesterase domain-containing protein [Glycomyces rhizosphaerae]|uniref:Acyl-CoA thioesterase domain-containing protein n=1 Tax=Glycomyces rhizosphaerae TaxID=2054422 RepID=A0ABV7Q863_9ACTN
MTSSDAYFERESEDRFRPTPQVGGGWNPAEQHISPAIGLLAHAIETEHDRRRGHRLQLSRLSCDILGTLPLETVEVDVTVVRPGRTIELVEARLIQAGRTAVLARAWLAQHFDTASLNATPLPRIPPPSSTALVKTALRTILSMRRFATESPPALRMDSHCLMVVGMMSLRRR